MGFSSAQADGVETSRRPPSPGQWGYADRYYFVPLKDFVPLPHVIPLRSLFLNEEAGLRRYFLSNQARPRNQKKSLFFVIQGGRLQCQNGAYLSEVDDELSDLLLGPTPPADSTSDDDIRKEVRTGERIMELRARSGQSAFSSDVRENFDFKCYFPDCPVSDSEFLIGAHIARWVDAPELRGTLTNGLCLCLMHDKAFEVGMFTFSSANTVWVNRLYAEEAPNVWFSTHVLPHDGQPIKKGKILPSGESLRQHWERTGFITSEPGTLLP